MLVNPGGVGVTQPTRHGPFQLRLKFGKQAHCVIEVRRREDAAEVAKKLRELGDQGGAGEGSELRESVGLVVPSGTALREQEDADVPATYLHDEASCSIY